MQDLLLHPLDSISAKMYLRHYSEGTVTFLQSNGQKSLLASPENLYRPIKPSNLFNSIFKIERERKSWH